MNHKPAAFQPQTARESHDKSKKVESRKAVEIAHLSPIIALLPWGKDFVGQALQLCCIQTGELNHQKKQFIFIIPEDFA